MGAHLTQAVRRERDRIYAQLIGSGLTQPCDIAQAAQEFPQFAGARYETIYYDVRMFLKRPEYVRVRTREEASEIGLADFDSVVDGITLRLPLGVLGEVMRLIDTLRAAWRKLEARAARVPELEERLRGLESRRSPDPDEALREENQRLRGIVERQGRRLEALGQQGNHHRPITEAHLALSSRD